MHQSTRTTAAAATVAGVTATTPFLVPRLLLIFLHLIAQANESGHVLASLPLLHNNSFVNIVFLTDTVPEASHSYSFQTYSPPRTRDNVYHSTVNHDTHDSPNDNDDEDSLDVTSNYLSVNDDENEEDGHGHAHGGYKEEDDAEEEEQEQAHGPPRYHHHQHEDSPLLGLHVDAGQVTLSGLSSGGGIAQQLFVSHSKLFSGIAIFQQTFYRCGRGDGDMEQFDNFCTNLGNLSSLAMSYDPRRALNDIYVYFSHGLIDDPRHLRNKRLYVYAGTNNIILRVDQQLALLRVFEPLIQNPTSIRTRVQHAASHLPTFNVGGRCEDDAEQTAFLGNCGLSGAHEALSFLLGEHNIKHKSSSFDKGSLLEFDQAEFFDPHAGAHSMARVGYIYVPAACVGEGHRHHHHHHRRRCWLHFYFHGCRAGSDVTGGRHLRFGGFLEVAEANSIVIVFPQIRTDGANPIGCWDSYGYTGPLYATQRGVQVSIIHRMLLRILGGGNG